MTISNDWGGGYEKLLQFDINFEEIRASWYDQHLEKTLQYAEPLCINTTATWQNVMIMAKL